MDSRIDCEALLRDAGDGVVVAGTDGTILFWNRAAERIFGHTQEEALGRSLDLIVPERFRERHWRGYREVMRTGRTRYGADVLRVPATGRDGDTISIAFTVTLLFAPGGKVQAIAALIRDETSRWREERELRRRLAELEARCDWSPSER